MDFSRRKLTSRKLRALVYVISFIRHCRRNTLQFVQYLMFLYLRYRNYFLFLLFFVKWYRILYGFIEFVRSCEKWRSRIGWCFFLGVVESGRELRRSSISKTFETMLGNLKWRSPSVFLREFKAQRGRRQCVSLWIFIVLAAFRNFV